jgi:sortase A
MTRCPYLRDCEQTTIATGPEQGLRCLAQHPPASPLRSAQARLCLLSAHTKCPYYQVAYAAASETAGDYPVVRPASGWRNLTERRRLVLLLAGATLVVTIGYLLANSIDVPGLRSRQPELQPLHTAVALAPATGTPTLVASETPTSPPPSATATATVRPQASSPPTRIRIPRINVDADVVEVAYSIREENGSRLTVWQVADYAVGFHVGSAYPGHAGNTVLAAHNNIRGRILRHLVDLVPGDDIYLYVGDLEFHYQVTQRMLVLETGMSEEIHRENAQWIQPTTDERLTLVSCWPFIKPDHRVVVVAHPCCQ